MKQFELVLKNDKERSYRKVSIFLLVINFISILFFTYLKGFTQWGPLIIAFAAIVSLFAPYYSKDEKKTFTAAFFLLSLAWLKASFWVGSVLNILFSFLNLVALQKPIVSITESQMIYPSFPKRKILWHELNNLMLKDGLLTIDFKNNKIIQQDITESLSAIDEKEFNDFCKQQLNK
jgi:hypothetical protein